MRTAAADLAAVLAAANHDRAVHATARLLAREQPQPEHIRAALARVGARRQLLGARTDALTAQAVNGGGPRTIAAAMAAGTRTAQLLRGALALTVRAHLHEGGQPGALHALRLAVMDYQDAAAAQRTAARALLALHDAGRP